MALALEGLLVVDGDVLGAARILEPRVLWADAGVVEAGEIECVELICPDTVSCSRYVRVPCSTPGVPSERVAEWRAVSTPSPAASTPTILTPLSPTKGWNMPIALEPPPTHATTQSGSRPTCESICERASSPITRWKSLTIVGNGCGPMAEPMR